jgi:RND family efflux transporter MFP subunit
MTGNREIVMNITGIKDKIRTMDRKSMFGASVGAAIAILAIGYMTFGKESGYASVPKVDPAVTVTTVIVEPRSTDSVVSAIGTLSSRNISVLSSKIMGKVVSLTANEGDHVAAGKLLMKIESGEISAQAYQAKAGYNNAKLHYDRIKSLFEGKAATLMEMDQAILGLESSQAGLNAAKAMESYTIITAPITGQIVEKRINLGEMALPGQPILKIEDNKNLRLEVTVKEQDLRFIQLGENVIVQIDAMPGQDINGRVAQVIPAADTRTHSFIVKIDVPTDKRLMTGMYGKALFITGHRDAILVPKTAVVEMSGLAGVYIVTGEGNAVFQMVQFGETRGDLVEAVTGLKAGDRVVMDKQLAGIDGRKVVVAQK